MIELFGRTTGYLLLFLGPESMSFKHEPVLEISAEPDVLQIEYRPENHDILTVNGQTSVNTRNSENSQRSRGSHDLEIPKLQYSCGTNRHTSLHWKKIINVKQLERNMGPMDILHRLGKI